MIARLAAHALGGIALALLVITAVAAREARADADATARYLAEKAGA